MLGVVKDLVLKVVGELGLLLSLLKVVCKIVLGCSLGQDSLQFLLLQTLLGLVLLLELLVG